MVVAFSQVHNAGATGYPASAPCPEHLCRTLEATGVHLRRSIVHELLVGHAAGHTRQVLLRLLPLLVKACHLLCYIKQPCNTSIPPLSSAFVCLVVHAPPMNCFPRLRKSCCNACTSKTSTGIWARVVACCTRPQSRILLHSWDVVLSGVKVDVRAGISTQEPTKQRWEAELGSCTETTCHGKEHFKPFGHHEHNGAAAGRRLSQRLRYCHLHNHRHL